VKIRIEKGKSLDLIGQHDRLYMESKTNYTFIYYMLPGREFPNDLVALAKFVGKGELNAEEINSGRFYFHGFRIWLEDALSE
jgi:hypothetical protein